MFQIGQKVRIKKDLIPGNTYGGITLFPGDMKDWRGAIVTVQRIEYGYYAVKENGFWWSEEMLERMYLPGEKVKVRQDLIVGNKYGDETFIESMTHHKGKHVTIKCVIDGKYRIDEGSWNWTNEMFESSDIKLNIVIVKHDIPGLDEYIFEVPNNMVPFVKKGSKFQVDSKDHVAIAISDVITEDITCDIVKSLIAKMGGHFPLTQVCEVAQIIQLNEIIIPKSFKKSPPSAGKIAKCYEYYKNNKKFDRDIVVDKGRVLIDGYVAYLVAKMFGLKKVEIISKYN